MFVNILKHFNLFQDEQKFDKIINVLYDSEYIQGKSIIATEIISSTRSRHGINWTDDEINFILTVLTSDGFISLSSSLKSDDSFPRYSLTIKGVQIKRNVGFFLAKIVEQSKNNIIICGSILALMLFLKLEPNAACF